LKREETLRKIAAEEKAKYLKVMKELEESKSVFAKESYERQMAELNVLRESIEKQRIVDTLLSNDRRYRKYTMDEIRIATNNLSEDLVIGEGGYGKVYKCNLDHTPVAIKVLHQETINKKAEFLKEVFPCALVFFFHLKLFIWSEFLKLSDSRVTVGVLQNIF
jgi:hypothetical protein